MRLRLALPVFAFIAACNPEPGIDPEELDGFIVDGALPEDADLSGILSEMSAGSFSLVGEPGSSEVAIVMAEGDAEARIASSEFSIVSATCIDCGDPTCASLQRTLRFTLAHNTGMSGDHFSQVQTSARNFSNPVANPASWTTPVGGQTVVDVTGTLTSCRTFNYTFDIIGAPRVFVTSTTRNGNFGGVAGMDTYCQNAANNAGLGGTWMAWASAGGSSPSSRFTRYSDIYQRIDGAIVANTYSDLTDGTLRAAINRTEFNVAVPSSAVWTGTGTTGAGSTPDCSGWTSSAGTGRRGTSAAVNSSWTSTGTLTCSALNRVYCFEQ